MKQASYDVAIIGSGMGGMCAAALLADAGYKILVVERLPFLGGRCSTVRYKGFTLTTGAMSLTAYDESPVNQVWNQLGAAYPVRPLPPDMVFQYRIKGRDYPVPEKDALRTLISLASEERAEVDRVMEAVERSISWQEPSAFISLRDWLLQYTHNELILRIFQNLCVGHIGANVHEVPASEFFHYLGHPVVTQVRGYAPEGNLAVIESLADAIRDRGGEFWTRCRARRIIVQDQAARGLIVEREGEEVEIRAGAVVSNAGPRRTVDLAESENFDRGYLREIKERLRPASHILLFIAMPGDQPLPARLYLTDTRRLFAIRSMTALCPELAPPGKQLIFASALPASSLPPINFKYEIELCLEDLKESIPGFDRYAEVLYVHCFRGGSDWPFYHSCSGYELPQKTSVVKLYNVGDGVKTPDWIGLEACAASARLVVADIKDRIEPGKA